MIVRLMLIRGRAFTTTSFNRPNPGRCSVGELFRKVQGYLIGMEWEEQVTKRHTSGCTNNGEPQEPTCPEAFLNHTCMAINIGDSDIFNFVFFK